MRGLPEHLHEHFLSDRFVGSPEGGHDLRGEARNAACGDHVVVYLSLGGERRVSAAGFPTQEGPINF